MTAALPPVVGIRASAGGIDAFREFFSAMPANSALAFVVLLHRPADGRPVLSSIIERWPSMPVLEVSSITPIEPNHV